MTDSFDPVVQSGVVVTPEDHISFRLGQLLLLLNTLAEIDPQGTHLERLGYYDFFAANPHLVVREGGPERGRLLMAGFDPSTLSYASAGHLFSSRRERLQHDLAILVSLGLVRPQVIPGHLTYEITSAGIETADAFRALYARSYVTSARTVVARLRRFSDSKLRTEARMWLRAPDALLDLIDRADVAEEDLG